MIKNKRKDSRDGYHYNTLYWRNYFKNLPVIKAPLLEVLVNMLLGDASFREQRSGQASHVKFEQGYKQKEFVYHLFDLFKEYCFTKQVCERIELRGSRKGQIKSYWFRTATHKSFTELRHLFYKNKLKYINIDYLRVTLTPRVLAYWVMSDGSLQKNKKTLILHTQGFNKEDNLGCCDLLNSKFELSSRVLSHKHCYWVIEIPSQDAGKLADLIDPYLIPCMYYKSPNLYKQSMT